MAVDISESQEQAIQFLEQHRIGVLATASNLGKPHAAAVYFTVDPDLNIYFVTRKGTRKSHNLHDNNQIAIAIYDKDTQTTLQAEGTAVGVAEPQVAQWVFNDIWRIAAQEGPNNPPPQTQLIGAGDYVVYKLAAPSLRLASYKQKTSASTEDIFSVVPTQHREHFNAYDKNVN